MLFTPLGDRASIFTKRVPPAGSLVGNPLRKIKGPRSRVVDVVDELRVVDVVDELRVVDVVDELRVVDVVDELEEIVDVVDVELFDPTESVGQLE